MTQEDVDVLIQANKESETLRKSMEENSTKV